MKEGYIVWNMTNYDKGYEFFGVFRSKEAARKHLRKVFKQRYGKDYFKLTTDEIYEIEDSQDDYRIDYFTLNNGEYGG